MAQVHAMSLDRISDAVSPSADSPRRWGNWSLQTDNWTLTYQNDEYAVDLENCNTPAEVLDWIFQVEGKAWATAQVLSDLLHAVSDIFDPQANLCSGGSSRRIKAPNFLRKRCFQPPMTPAKTKPAGVQLEAQEFLDAVMAHPVGDKFDLWNLQGDMGVRLSCQRRGKCPAEIDFACEALAKRFGWLRELAEDEDFTRDCRDDYKTDVRYGQTFVRTATNSMIKAQRQRFVSAFVAARRSDHLASASN
jgi:hypothetical protein